MTACLLLGRPLYDAARGPRRGLLRNIAVGIAVPGALCCGSVAEHGKRWGDHWVYLAFAGLGQFVMFGRHVLS